MSEEASAQAADTPPVRSGAAAFIFVTILLDMLALGLILPILPKLVESFVDNDTATAARIFGLFGTAWALMQFLFSPILGALSDRFGRRPVVLLSNFGLALDYVLMALAPTLIWLFIGRVISGITSASISTAFAYIADVTPPERRAAVFGKIGAAFGAGFILGPAIGGLLGGMDPRLPFWIAAGLSFANTLYGWLILPESLPPERRAPFRWKSANPLGALHLLRSNRILAGLSLANFFGQVAHVVLPSTFVLYATYRYGWDTTTVGLTLALVGVCAMVVQGAGVGPIVKRLGERRALLLGLACGALGFFIYGAAPTGPLFWIGIPVMSLWGVAGAAIQALTTQLVAPDQQGQLQGATNSVNSIAQMLGPFLFTLTFAYFISDQAPLKMPGAPFLLAAALLGLGLVIAWRRWRARSENPHPEERLLGRVSKDEGRPVASRASLTVHWCLVHQMSSWYHDTPFQPERGKFQRDLSIKGACDHVVDHEVTEPYADGGATGGPPCSIQLNNSWRGPSAVSSSIQDILTLPVGTDSAPYLMAFVASS